MELANEKEVNAGEFTNKQRSRVGSLLRHVVCLFLVAYGAKSKSTTNRLELSLKEPVQHVLMPNTPEFR